MLRCDWSVVASVLAADCQAPRLLVSRALCDSHKAMSQALEYNMPLSGSMYTQQPSCARQLQPQQHWGKAFLGQKHVYRALSRQCCQAQPGECYLFHTTAYEPPVRCQLLTPDCSTLATPPVVIGTRACCLFHCCYCCCCGSFKPNFNYEFSLGGMIGELHTARHGQAWPAAAAL